jgi:thiamine-phosphate pyrophosphorylase
MVTDRTRYAASDDDRAMLHVVEDVRRAARAGVNLIQVRERGVSDRALLLHAREVLAAVEGTAARVLVNARADVALAARADGVHLPASSPPAFRVRALLPPESLLGRSVHDLGEALAAEQQGGCDYLVFGTVYPSASKPPTHEVAGVDALARVCAAVRLPVLAIGGIGPDRLAEVAAAGAAGVAAIGMFVSGADSGAPDVAAFVARVRELFGAGQETSRKPAGAATERIHRS